MKILGGWRVAEGSVATSLLRKESPIPGRDGEEGMGKHLQESPWLRLQPKLLKEYCLLWPGRQCVIVIGVPPVQQGDQRRWPKTVV